MSNLRPQAAQGPDAQPVTTRKQIVFTKDVHVSLDVLCAIQQVLDDDADVLVALPDGVEVRTFVG